MPHSHKAKLDEFRIDCVDPNKAENTSLVMNKDGLSVSKDGKERLSISGEQSSLKGSWSFDKSPSIPVGTEDDSAVNKNQVSQLIRESGILDASLLEEHNKSAVSHDDIRKLIAAEVKRAIAAEKANAEAIALKANKTDNAIGLDSSANWAESSAFGRNAKASGWGSLALGYSSIADEMHSVAVGTFAFTDGVSCVSLGNGASSGGQSTNAIGSGSSSNGFASTALGTSSKSFGLLSTALGAYSLVIDECTTALGVYSSATFFHAIALGAVSSSSGEAAIALGVYATSEGFRSIALGDHTTALGDNSMSLGPSTHALGENTAMLCNIGGTAALPNSITMEARNPSYGRGVRLVMVCEEPRAKPQDYLIFQIMDGLNIGTIGVKVPALSFLNMLLELPEAERYNVSPEEEVGGDSSYGSSY